MQGSKTAMVMDKYNIHPHKKYGQNFLRDDNILGKIVEKSGINSENTVLEIGPGLGSLTAKLAQSAEKVIAIEIDNDLIPVLSDTLKEYDNVEIINADIMKTDLSEVLYKRNITGDVHVVANLPYYITTPVIMKLLEEDITYNDEKPCKIKSITVMVQTEVAERMQAGPGTKDYGALSLAVQYRSKAEIVMKVSPECFIPRPKVESAVIRLDIYDKNERPFKTDNENLLFSIIKASFGQRRKKLSNSLANAGISGIDKDSIEKALVKMGLDAGIRGEVLNLKQFIELTDLLFSGCVEAF